MALSEKRKGEWFIFSATFIGAFFPIITVLSLTNIPPLISLGWSTALSALFFGLFVLYRKTWREFGNPILWKYMFFIVLFIGLLTYGLIFFALEKTTPGNVAVIELFAVFTSFLFFNVWRREGISFEYKIGSILMIVGALTVLAPGFAGVNIGDLLVLAAMFCTPLGNFYQQKAREVASSETIMFLRSVISAPIIFLIAYAIGAHVPFRNIQTALPFLFINGVVILGLSKIFWIEGIHRVLVTKAEAFNSAGPFLTLFLAFVVLHQTPTIWQVTSLVPLLLGVLFLTDHLKFSRR